MKETLKRMIDQYLREGAKRRTHHIDISVPGHDGRFWIIDASLFTEQTGSKGQQLAIYFSVSPYSKKGRRIVPVIDLLDTFAGYEQAIDGRFTVYYQLTDNNSNAISAAVATKIQTLFPTIALKEVQLSLAPMDEWTASGE